MGALARLRYDMVFQLQQQERAAATKIQSLQRGRVAMGALARLRYDMVLQLQQQVPNPPAISNDQPGEASELARQVYGGGPPLSPHVDKGVSRNFADNLDDPLLLPQPVANDYDGKSKEELSKICTGRHLTHSGTKAQLLKRLSDFDAGDRSKLKRKAATSEAATSEVAATSDAATSKEVTVKTRKKVAKKGKSDPASPKPSPANCRRA